MTQVIELRQYALRVGMRDTLISLFDQALTRGQERAGMTVFGQFRDLDNPNAFVWIRGFTDLDDRARALTEFYDGPVWAEHREAANATMLDATNVLLLEPAEDGSSFKVALASSSPAEGFVEVTILHLNRSTSRVEALAFFRGVVAPRLIQAGGSVLGYFFTETRPNNFRRLPIREGANALVWIVGYAEKRYTDDRLSKTRVRASVISAHAPGARRAPDVLRLVPTAHSLLTGGSPACPSTDTLSPIST